MARVWGFDKPDRERVTRAGAETEEVLVVGANAFGNVFRNCELGVAVAFVPLSYT